MAAIEEGQEQVIADVKRISGPYHEESWMPKDARELCGSILSTVYLGMEVSYSALEIRVHGLTRFSTTRNNLQPRLVVAPNVWPKV